MYLDGVTSTALRPDQLNGLFGQGGSGHDQRRECDSGDDQLENGLPCCASSFDRRFDRRIDGGPAVEGGRKSVASRRPPNWCFNLLTSAMR